MVLFYLEAPHFREFFATFANVRCLTTYDRIDTEGANINSHLGSILILHRVHLRPKNPCTAKAM